MRYRTQVWLMLLPFLLGMTVLVVLPAAGSLAVPITYNSLDQVD